MFTLPRVAAAAAIAVLSAAPMAAQKSAPAKDQTFGVTFAFSNDQTYTGTMTLRFEGERVSGKMSVDSPQTVTGTVAGTLKGDTLALDYPFDVSGDQPCSGRVMVTARFNADGTEAKGTTHAEGCGDEPLDGEFTMSKKDVRK